MSTIIFLSGRGLLAKGMMGFTPPKKASSGRSLQGSWRRWQKKVTFGGSKVSETRENRDLLKELIETDKFQTVLDHIFPMEEIAEAHRYVEKGSKKGNITISIAS